MICLWGQSWGPALFHCLPTHNGLRVLGLHILGHENSNPKLTATQGLTAGGGTAADVRQHTVGRGRGRQGPNAFEKAKGVALVQKIQGLPAGLGPTDQLQHLQTPTDQRGMVRALAIRGRKRAASSNAGSRLLPRHSSDRALPTYPPPSPPPRTHTYTVPSPCDRDVHLPSAAHSPALPRSLCDAALPHLDG